MLAWCVHVDMVCACGYGVCMWIWCDCHIFGLSSSDKQVFGVYFYE